MRLFRGISILLGYSNFPCRRLFHSFKAVYADAAGRIPQFSKVEHILSPVSSMSNVWSGGIFPRDRLQLPLSSGLWGGCLSLSIVLAARVAYAAC